MALFPFVAGVPLDRERADLRLAAARLLARLHRVTLTWPDSRSPARRADASSDPPAIPGTTRLHEPSLSAWHEGLYRMAGGLTEGPIHGDYYRRNVLCADGSIVGVIAWDESRYDFLMQKVALSAWEFGKTPSGDDLLLDRARAFPRANAEAGGPCAESEYAHVLPLIRWRLWKVVRSQLTAIARGEQVDRDYLESELRAFRRVRDIPASELDVTRAGSA